MTTEFHVVIVPLYHWGLITPNDFNELTNLMKAISRLFRFDIQGVEQSRFTQDDSDFSPILSERLPHITTFVPWIQEITNQIKALSEEETIELKIERAYATDFAIEFVSSSPDLFSKWSKSTCGKMCRKLFSFLHNFPKPSPTYFMNIEIKKIQVDPILVFRFALCDSMADLKPLSQTLKLNNIGNNIYLGRRNTQGFDNAFNFRSNSWSDLYIPNIMATLKPSKLNHLGLDKLFEILSHVHTLGKFYVISQSVNGASANLEWSSWYLDSRLFKKYKSYLCWTQRNLTDPTKKISEVENEINEYVSPLTLLVTHPDAIDLIEYEYGPDFFSINRGTLYNLTKKQHITNYVFKTKAAKFDAKALTSSFEDSLKILAKSIDKFLKKFKNTADTWKDTLRSNRSQNQLLISLAGVILTLIINIIALVLGNH